MTPAWHRIADGVHVWRYPVLDVNVTAVSGEASTLVVDTLSTAAQARALAAALWRLPARRLTIVNTHAHFDHCFGNATLLATAAERGDPDVEIWAHPTTGHRLRAAGATLIAAAAAEFPDLAAELVTTRVAPPTRAVADEAWLDLGGRAVRLLHPGRGHTAGDLVVQVPDAGVLIAGDLVEQGAPPQFDDAYPLAWAAALGRLLPLAAGPVVPGHGAVVDAEFLARTRDELASLADRITTGFAAGASVDRVAAAGPYDEATRRRAATRGYAHLRGRGGTG